MERDIEEREGDLNIKMINALLPLPKGQISNAVRGMTSTGVGDLEDAAVGAQMESKYYIIFP